MTNSTCSVDTCDTPAKTRGWCMRHYRQQYRGEPLTQRIETAECPNCGDAFTVKHGMIYCGSQCRESAKYASKRNDATRWAKYLEQERTSYVKKTEQPGYIHPLAKEPTPCSEDGCSRNSVGRGWCKMHYRRWARAQGLENSPSAAWSDARRSNYHARRARLNGATRNNKVLIAAIIDRDGLTCTWCGTDIDMTLTYPDRHSKSVDHTLPLSRGGAHTLDNTTLMHLTCNLSKGTKVGATHKG